MNTIIDIVINNEGYDEKNSFFIKIRELNISKSNRLTKLMCNNDVEHEISSMC